MFCKFYNLEHLLVDCEISSFSKRYIFLTEADLERSRTDSLPNHQNKCFVCCQLIMDTQI